MKNFKIIADSGSTKTDWIVLDENSNIVEDIKTIGFNPYFHSSEFIFNEVERAFMSLTDLTDDVVEVHYYGAGCSTKEKNKIIKEALKSLFPNSQISINHDLVAAARATLGSDDGIACIIGTGSNSCLWVNSNIEENIPSHGYIFGDEGSGSFLGIELLKLYLEDKLPLNLKTSFEKTFKLSKDQILNATYKEKSPNVFLAHFASFYTPHCNEPILQEIMLRGFKNFFDKRVVPYNDFKKYKLGFVGSIAYHFDDLLRKTAESYGMEIYSISKCPIDNLVPYHSNNNTLKAI